MATKFHRSVSGLLVLPVLFSLAGCDKLKAVAGALQKKEEAKPDGPAVQGTFSQNQISNITSADFAGFTSRKDALVIVDFHADWCGPCRLLGPVLEKAAEAHPGVVYVGKVNVDQAPDLAAAQGVSGIPDVRIFKNGREVDRFVGFPGEKQVLEKIAELSRGITPTAATTPAAKPPAEPVIQPFKKDWMPPGMKRQSSGAP